MSEAENTPVQTNLPDCEVAFLNECDLRVVNGGNWLQLATFSASVAYEGQPVHIIEVPAGTLTDLASVPRWLPYAYAIFGGRGRKAAVLHDWLCRNGVDRKFADAVFWGALVAEEGPVVASAMWTAVRAYSSITT
jgi:hypothetical protein